ncbi:MAG: ACP S-malonyltransferase [Mariprofundales bacterium]|nr:ACP S-malonyltransferase [Mariprofundales bacterium]
MTHSDLAWIFPGQGSQSVGMLAELLADSGVVQETFAEASEVLGYDLSQLVRQGPVDQLNQTEHTQPALLVASIAMVRWWRAMDGPEAGHLAGHSLGEYSALVAAGAIAFADAVTLVAFRGQAMAACGLKTGAEVGCMAAILGLDEELLTALCQQASSGDDGQVWVANLNCPGQVVVSGHAAAVSCVTVLAKTAGAKRTVMLDVSVPSHTPLMMPAAESMAQRLSEIEVRNPDRPVWCNTTASMVHNADAVRQALVAQLTLPVQWTLSVRAMADAGVMQTVEMGPGKVLAGLVRRINRSIKVFSGETARTMGRNIESIVGVVI